MVISCDIAVIGGGLAGLTATAALHAQALDAICIDPAPPPQSLSAMGADLRSTAVLEPGVQLLEQAGLWPDLAPHATALEVMRIIALDSEMHVQTDASFASTEIGLPQFGWNLPNWRFRHILAAGLPEHAVMFGRRLKAIWPRADSVRLLLDNDDLLDAKLVIAADGRNSFTRNALAIKTTQSQYGQDALVFCVSHSEPHNNISTEFHSQGGPLTFVPLPDHHGKPASAIVWMTDSAEAKRLHALEDGALAEALNIRSARHYSALEVISPRAIWPIISQHSCSLISKRTALIAEAAHVMPPIGAQGLNMSFADIQCLVDLVQQDRDNIGSDAWLRKYARARMPDIRARMLGVDMLNRVAQTGRPAHRKMRAEMLRGLNSMPLIRRGLIQAGLGRRPINPIGMWRSGLGSRNAR